MASDTPARQRAARRMRSGAGPNGGDRLREIVNNSFWFLPVVMTLAMTGLAWGTLTLDEHLPANWGGLLDNGGLDGARYVLSAIATSMITVAATVFSITIVAMTLASSQFGPRMLHNFVRDRGNQASIGFFGAVFLYALLVLRNVNGSQPLPNVSTTVAVVLAIVAIVVLIYFIHHIATSIQAMHLVELIAGDLRGSIDRIFPEQQDLDASPVSEAPDLEGHGHAVHAEASGYVQLIDVDRIVEIAEEHSLLVRLDIRPGRFAVTSTSVAHVWAEDGSRTDPDDEILHSIAESFTCGPQRIKAEDVEFPLRQLVEVAVRALSPAINDPFTASACVNHIGAALCRAAAREFPPRIYAGDDGRARLLLGDPVTFERFVGESFDQVRQAAAEHVFVYLHLLEALTRVLDCTQDEERWAVLGRQADLVVERARQVVPQQADLDVVEERYAAFGEAVAHERHDQ